MVSALRSEFIVLSARHWTEKFSNASSASRADCRPRRPRSAMLLSNFGPITPAWIVGDTGFGVGAGPVITGWLLMVRFLFFWLGLSGSDMLRVYIRLGARRQLVRGGSRRSGTAMAPAAACAALNAAVAASAAVRSSTT